MKEQYPSAKFRENNYFVESSLHQIVRLTETERHRFSPLLTTSDRKQLELEKRDEDQLMRVWDDSVDTTNATIKYAPKINTRCVVSVADVALEARRQAMDRRLRRFFKAILHKLDPPMAPPIQAFERWMFNARVSATTKQRAADALLPFNIFKEDGLVADLVRAGLTEKRAKNLTKQLGKESTACVNQLKNPISTGKNCTNAADEIKSSKDEKDDLDETAGAQRVTITYHVNSVDVTFGKHSFCKLTHVHFKKLEALYTRFSGHSDGNKNNSNKTEKKEAGEKKDGKGDAATATAAAFDANFSNALMTLLLRYQSILGHGFQASVPNVAFNVLQREFGVDFECFASPLNCRWGRYCSAFVDTDAAFGSLGDFFSFKPMQGSFEVNPPFVRPIMEKAAIHVESLLEKAEASKKALSFVVILPGWEECTCWALMKNSKWLQTMTILPPGNHGFLDGAQHQRQDKYRPSPYPTGFFFLQTKAATTKWPVTETKVAILRYAMLISMPSEAEAARRMRAGRGFGTLDGGGGVYKGKKKRRRNNYGGWNDNGYSGDKDDYEDGENGNERYQDGEKEGANNNYEDDTNEIY
ncbi:mRNA (2'-O-methyladenosine-N(6)-)-methyltransferase [Physocladia obscura]|uniref:mRNA (2'-O-methyladenosine-N(6)-)-methyltransferase n=1 Tax=Physocladia obscura TaxID=109957 RepID=A0AAD5XG01_9FUNG|nr:mRNA (2'-O-methyladenosine-N(6)-)-methyltransferase [Physocladia obscura]